MAHIFLSYSRKDSRVIGKLVERLEAAGISVWLDRDDIRVGDQWRRRIVTAIEDCDAFVIALSPNSILSDNVRKELDLAEGENKKILPIEIVSTELPPEMKYQLVGLQRISFGEEFDEGFTQLLGVLGVAIEESQRIISIKDYKEEYSDFLKQPGTDLVKMDPILSKDGRVYYSFIRRSHDYGQGSDIQLKERKFRTGFAGADYGYFLTIGNTNIETLAETGINPPDWLEVEKHKAWHYLWTYKPPREMEVIRQHQDEARGKTVGKATISEGTIVIEGMAYLLRSILIDEYDILVGFRAQKINDDNSVILVSKILKTFDTPVVHRKK